MAPADSSGLTMVDEEQVPIADVRPGLRHFYTIYLLPSLFECIESSSGLSPSVEDDMVEAVYFGGVDSRLPELRCPTVGAN